MNFDLDDDQRLLKETVERLVARDYVFEKRQQFVASLDGFSRAVWSRFAELGLTALTIPETDGGIGKTPVETMVVMEALGRALATEPFLSTAVIAARLLARYGTPMQKNKWLPRIADGSAVIALATTERHSGFDLGAVESRIIRAGDGYRLQGAKSLVLHGAVADAVLVSAKLDDGVAVALLDPSARGVTRRAYRLQDGSPAAEIGFDAVMLDPAALVAGPEDGMDALRDAEAVAIAACCAEAVGVMSEMQAMTLDYIKTRRQFGVAIGTFQALQHRAAEMFVALEQARSMAMLAAVHCKDPDVIARDRAISAAKVQICESGRFIGQNAVQLHGGIGMTMEYRLGHLFKRMTMLEILFGDIDHHLDRVAALDGFPEAA